MFNSKESLYINAIKYDTQLKLDYKQLNGDEISKTNSYVHLVDDEILAKDIAHKINVSQEEVDIAYISTLLINDTAFLIPKNKQLNDEYEVCDFNDTYNIAIAKTTLFETKHYFNKTGVDFIYSAYHVLNLHLEKNIAKNELLVFLFNNKAFLIILNETSSIVYSSCVELPKFADIKKTHFYEDEIVGQKLYDEIYFLELSELIEENLNKFYLDSKKVFVEKITILYAIKQLEKEQINSLKEELLLDVEYHPINVEEEIFELSKDKHQRKSFVKPRKKEKSSSNFLLGVIVVLLLLIALITYKIFESKEDVKTIESKKTQLLQTNSNVILPDHVNINDKVEKNIKKLFNIIPYDVVLNGFVLYENSVKLDVILLTDDTYIKSLEPELKTILKKSSISVKNKEQKISQEAIILASDYIKEIKSVKRVTQKYIDDDFLPKQRVTEQLKILFPESAIIKFKENNQSKYSSYEYNVNLLVNTPNEFFEIIDSLNKELYSIYIDYPIKMNRVNNKIEVEFVLIFNQINN